jgi:DNA-binding CsgD family transcriptional regulator
MSAAFICPQYGRERILRRPMDDETSNDTNRLLELVGEAYSLADLAQFRSAVLEILGRMVPCDSAGYNEVGPDETFAVTTAGVDPGLLPVFSALAHQHPLIRRYQRTGDGRPYRISDMIDQRTFHGLALYQEFYRRIAVEWQVAFTLPARSPFIIGIVLCRAHEDFSTREMRLLALARPHLIQAYRNAELWGARTAMLAALEEGLDMLGRHVVVLDPEGRVEFATDGARRLLGDKGATRIPSEVGAWIARQRSPRSAAEPLVLHGSSGRILVRVLPTRREDRRQVLLLEGGTGALSVTALRGFGLSARQAESLRYLALGHSPSQIASQMGIARRTVDKHLQNVYAKLGATTSSEATATAWAAVGVERSAEA